MITDDLWKLPASTLRAKIGAKEISPVDLMKAVLERADNLQPVLNCFITIVPEMAMAAAKHAENEVMKGEALGLLHGIPFAAKDREYRRWRHFRLAAVRGQRARGRRRRRPHEGGGLVQRPRRRSSVQGADRRAPVWPHAQCLSAEYTRRPRRRCGRGPAGIGPIGIATDGGGSTRIPAAANGMVGLKQSNGVIPHSQVADAFGNYTYVTPMTRTVQDTGLMLWAMAGPHRSDPWSIEVQPKDYITAAKAEGDLKGKRILFSLTLGNRIVAKEVRASFERALGKLRELGAELVELTEPLPDMEPIWKVINHTTWRARFDDLIRREGNKISPSLVRQVAMAEQWSGTDYQRAMFQRTDLFRMVQRWFETADYLVTPTLSRTALPIDQDLFEPIKIDGTEVGELRRNWFPYTMPFNITGHPAITLCSGYDGEGLPIGLQIVGRFRDEASVLRAASLYEASENWLSHRPDL
jgi:aspartyl-tRNA(Asn)/glutamyl-tRNA(Gln) amidotransferase subunit A